MDIVSYTSEVQILIFKMVITYFCVMFHFICIATLSDEITGVANIQAKWKDICLAVSVTLTYGRKIRRLKLHVILHTFRL
jgi:hypothetical protein